MKAKGLRKFLRSSWHMMSIGNSSYFRHKGTCSDDGLGFLTTYGRLHLVIASCLVNECLCSQILNKCSFDRSFDHHFLIKGPSCEENICAW